MSKRHAFLAVAILGGLIVGVLVGPSTAAPAAYTPLAKVRPDAVLSPGQSHTFRGTTALVGNGVLGGTPASCRARGSVASLGDPQGFVGGLGCSVFRIRLRIDKNPEAMNVVFIRAEFEQIKLPVINIPQVAPLELTPLNGLDVFVYNTADHTVPSGAASYGAPEIGSFLVGQPEYDIVVQSDPGINRAFTLKLSFSNELFPPQREAGDLTELLPSLSPDLSSTQDLPLIADGSVELGRLLDKLPIATDPDIARVGVGVLGQFDANELAGIDQAIRPTAPPAAPSTAALLLGMVALPGVAMLGVGLGLRRRRRALI